MLAMEKISVVQLFNQSHPFLDRITMWRHLKSFLRRPSCFLLMLLLTGDAEFYDKAYVNIGGVSIVGALALSYKLIC